MYSKELFRNVIAVSNRHLCDRQIEIQIERICAYHPKAIVLREKDLSEEAYYHLAKRVTAICKRNGILCILHSFADVARRLDHQALHLPLPLLRQYRGGLNDFNLLGTSVHTLEEAREAKQYGVDYAVAGHIYATGCKPGIEPRGVEFLSHLCRNVKLPVYGIGGINLDKEQMAELLTAGARGGFIMSAMMKL